MFKFLKNIFFTYFVCAILLSFVAHADSEESFAELSEELAEVTKDFNELDTSSLQEAAVIDNSIREINKAIEFAQQNIEDGNSEIALKTVTFVNKSLSDISSALPKSYDSNMDNADMASLGEEGLETVTTVVEGLGEKKEKDKAEMITTMLDINDSGFDAFEISRNLNSFGINTIKVDLDVKTKSHHSIN